MFWILALCVYLIEVWLFSHIKIHTTALCILYMAALLTIFCGSFLDDFLWLCWQFFCGGFLDDFVDNFLQRLFRRLCWQFFCCGFLDEFVDNFLLRLFRRLCWQFFTAFCFALYAVQSSYTQYKSLLHVLRGGGGCKTGGGEGVCVCKSYSMDSLLLSKIFFCS